MAVKKSELYSSLWASCDSLRGGMDSSQYKDYILTLVFVKYVSDKYKNVKYGDIKIVDGGSFDDMLALIGNKDIGKGMDEIIGRLADENNLRGVIDNAHFNDDDKLGRGGEMVDKLSELLCIFRDQMPDFSKNHADGDDIIGDAYEYLMRNFATESGKSKGQFYTPAEVSRVVAKIIGIERVCSENITLHDPACGSGSLALRTAMVSPASVSIYAQEKDVTTAGLARMNFVLHNLATVEIKGGYSTFSDPITCPSDDNALRQFDFAVLNPPFSDKNWTHGLKECGRFDGYEDRPPQKNGDFAWLLHIVKSLKDSGKGAVILPHGALFRGNAEAAIRRLLVDKGYIKGIIGLPANLFYGTSIPACIIVIDKENADKRNGVIMIDASRDFVKEGNKNRLRERDVYKITTIFNMFVDNPRAVHDPKYARFVPVGEIIDRNGYNLNLSRYIDSGEPEDIQNIDGHLNSGIPSEDVDSLALYWQTFPKLQEALFAPLRDKFYSLAVDKASIRGTINSDSDFSAYADRIETAMQSWINSVDNRLHNISGDTRPRLMIQELAAQILEKFEQTTLLDKYDAYEVLLSYWNEIMSDDVYIIVQDGYEAAREVESFKRTTSAKRKDGITVKREREIGWEGKLLPKALIIEMFFADEQEAINAAEMALASAQAELDSVIDNAEEDSVIMEALSDNGRVNKSALKKKLKYTELLEEDRAVLQKIQDLLTQADEGAKKLRGLRAALDKSSRSQYSALKDEQITELLLNRKWYCSIRFGVYELYAAVSRRISERVTELAERYEKTMPQLEHEAAGLEARVKAHLERMKFAW